LELGIQTRHNRVPIPDDDLHNWIKRNCQYFHHGLFSYPKLITELLAITTWLFWTFVAWFSFPNDFSSPFFSEGCQTAMYRQLYGVQAMQLPAALFVDYVQRKLLKVEENLFLHQELQLHVLISIPIFGSTVLYAFPSFSQYGHGLYLFVMGIVVTPLCWSFACSPFHFSRHRLAFQDNLVDNIKHLTAILRDNGEEFSKFEEFMRRELNPVPVYFWKAIEKLKALKRDEAQDYLLEILNTFIASPESHHTKLKLSPQLRSVLARFLHNNSLSDVPSEEFYEMARSVLEAAQQEVLLQIIQDSFPRYIAENDDKK
jgi:hypothetical protein